MRRFDFIALWAGVLFAAIRLEAQQWVSFQYDFVTQTDIAYGVALDYNGQWDTLRLDLYQPICQDTSKLARRPLAVVIHGGAFIAGNKKDIAELCRQFARGGYVAASVQYRLGFVNHSSKWTCNYPVYSCVFAADTAEWIRAWYRGVQDVKGAIRYLANRADEYRIDPDNVFLAGESAGGFIALGVAFMDMPGEKPAEAHALPPLPKPAIHPAMQICPHNVGRIFSDSIARPDLGPIEGDIEQPATPYVVRGVANIYGGMLQDLLEQAPPDKHKAAIYQFHRPCDPVVPFVQGRVYAGLSWCLSNCYGCYGISFTPYVYGSKRISDWSAAKNYSHPTRNDFTTTGFPFNCLFGAASCLDQINNPCHALDNAALRYQRMAEWFAPQISIPYYCLSDSLVVHAVSLPDPILHFTLSPNPAGESLQLHNGHAEPLRYLITDSQGAARMEGEIAAGASVTLSVGSLPAGLYFAVVSNRQGRRVARPWVRI